MSKNPLSEQEMVERILEGARKGGRSSQAKRSPEERAAIGRKGGSVVKKAFLKIRK